MHILQSEKNKNTDRRKKALELIEFLAVVAICVIMFLHERNVAEQADVGELPDLGDRVLFGTYLGEPIEWRVLQAAPNGEVVLIAENILTMKAFNAPDSGSFNCDEENDYWDIHETQADTDMELQAYVRGNSCWAVSDLRAWLNSDRENVIYEGIGPVASAMCEHKNGYADEPGFLRGFTEQERAAIVPTEHVTNPNALYEEAVPSTDLVYLLSQEELSWLEEADVGVRAKPTKQAAEQDQTTWYHTYSLQFGVEAYYWWLREPVPDKASYCYVVDNGYKARLLRADKAAGLEGIGVRPVVRIDTKKIALTYMEPEKDETDKTETTIESAKESEIEAKSQEE